jgi:hypothetical protein
MLHACHLVAKRDPSVLARDIDTTRATTAISNEEATAAAAFQMTRQQSKT